MDQILDVNPNNANEFSDEPNLNTRPTMWNTTVTDRVLNSVNVCSVF